MINAHPLARAIMAKPVPRLHHKGKGGSADKLLPPARNRAIPYAGAESARAETAPVQIIWEKASGLGSLIASHALTARKVRVNAGGVLIRTKAMSGSERFEEMAPKALAEEAAVMSAMREDRGTAWTRK
jgi:hypothetical protein